MTKEHKTMLADVMLSDKSWKVLADELERLEAIEEKWNALAEAEFLQEIKEKGVSM